MKVLLLASLVTLYATTLAARAVTSGFRVLAGPLLGLAVLAAGTWVNTQMRFIPLQWSLLSRGLMLSILALILASVWERRGGVWGGPIAESWSPGT